MKCKSSPRSIISSFLNRIAKVLSWPFLSLIPLNATKFFLGKRSTAGSYFRVAAQCVWKGSLPIWFRVYHFTLYLSQQVDHVHVSEVRQGIVPHSLTDTDSFFANLEWACVPSVRRSVDVRRGESERRTENLLRSGWEFLISALPFVVFSVFCRSIYFSAIPTSNYLPQASKTNQSWRPNSLYLLIFPLIYWVFRFRKYCREQHTCAALLRNFTRFSFFFI